MWVNEGGKETKLNFSGDIGNTNQPFIRDPHQFSEADYVIMESTYGNRMHEHSDDKLEMLKKAICDAYNRGGKLLIPAFAAGRTQDILYCINKLTVPMKFHTCPYILIVPWLLPPQRYLRNTIISVI
ncbi:hypothetical protein N752_05430 [Desulforamulus aquiferis]|nr:hypothetical protein [Desulforamulus aquiferis]RYD06336.1 hypothetical protein N752_05430 [Desulforamulus aquiferis]